MEKSKKMALTKSDSHKPGKPVFFLTSNKYIHINMCIVLFIFACSALNWAFQHNPKVVTKPSTPAAKIEKPNQHPIHSI